MNEKNLEKIMTLRKKLEELDQDLNKIKNKNSFFKFFLKSLVLSFIFLLISKYINLKDESKIMIFVGVFVLSNIFQIFFTSKKQKEEIEKINKEQIKIQAEIFSLLKDSSNWNKLRIKYNISSQRLKAVSYTHLTLPTTPYV